MSVENRGRERRRKELVLLRLRTKASPQPDRVPAHGRRLGRVLFQADHGPGESWLSCDFRTLCPVLLLWGCCRICPLLTTSGVCYRGDRSTTRRTGRTSNGAMAFPSSWTSWVLKRFLVAYLAVHVCADPKMHRFICLARHWEGTSHRSFRSTGRSVSSLSCSATHSSTPSRSG